MLLKNTRLSETMTIEKLPSGLTCYIVPRKGFTEKQAMLVADFGSADISFCTETGLLNIPQGLAHFLEHKMFEGKTFDYFDKFAELGGYVNAFTDFDITAYYFTCSNNFIKCLSLLLNMVYTPYFTDKSIEKEKEIIEQEIKMYDDDPAWKVYFNMLQGLYKNSPVRYEACGTVTSIAEINKDILYKCHNIFYTPQNIALICIGDFSPTEIISYLKNETPLQSGVYAKKLYGEEAGCSFEKKSQQSMSISRPMFCLGFKDDNSKNKAEAYAASQILLDILIGQSSGLYNRLYMSGIIDSSFYTDYSNGNCHSNTIFAGASCNPDSAVSAIFCGINELRKNGIESGLFERIKNKHIGRYIRSFNSAGYIANMQAELYGKGFTVFDLMDTFMSIEKNDIRERLELFSEDSYCLSVINPF